jgi:hypothetical protein
MVVSKERNTIAGSAQLTHVPLTTADDAERPYVSFE